MAEDPNFDHLSYNEMDSLGMMQAEIELLKQELEEMKPDRKLIFIYMTII